MPKAEGATGTGTAGICTMWDLAANLETEKWARNLKISSLKRWRYTAETLGSNPAHGRPPK
jgi:hypothetical protein